MPFILSDAVGLKAVHSTHYWSFAISDLKYCSCWKVLRNIGQVWNSVFHGSKRIGLWVCSKYYVSYVCAVKRCYWLCVKYRRLGAHHKTIVLPKGDFLHSLITFLASILQDLLAIFVFFMEIISGMSGLNIFFLNND